IITEYKEFIGRRTNNQAEYSALKKALEIASAIDKYATVFSDSELVINQRNNKMKVRNKQLKTICRDISKLESHFNGIVYRHVPREKNTEADILANKAIDEYLKYKNSKL
ncbi:MAG TPA: ribonuclease HI family protein, partial [Nitrososphaeraceae archaeon]|nr:ribonuclease HI family protein [Nitrososphaeraceae archaeon]